MMSATRGSNKRGREEDEQSDASSAVKPATEFLDHLRGRPEGGDPDGRLLPLLRPEAGRAIERLLEMDEQELLEFYELGGPAGAEVQY
ncbi:hypothetical protein DL771_001781 [Monosporascus sp. 5C6A]|nr:hypothetical protein DL771_001781 [Monosporascus sp. 5C6A]